MTYYGLISAIRPLFIIPPIFGQKRERGQTMANSKIYAFVVKFADAVTEYAIAQQSTNAAKRIVRSLKGIAEVLTETDQESISVVSGENGEISDLFTLTGINEAIDLYAAIVDATTQDGTDLAKRANRVKSYIEDDLLEEGDPENADIPNEKLVAENALKVWEAVKPRQGGQGARGVTRMSEADFEYAIYGTCSECGETVKTGERTGRTDWNSLRHYCQQHAKETHNSEGFTGVVRDAWRDAKAAFEGGADSVVVEGDVDTPSFSLARAS
jgi:hypothetical protein